MTDTATSTPRRVYVRGIGQATVLEIHHDHSATVRYTPGTAFREDGAEERIPFGDWLYEPDHPEENAVDVSYRLRSVLQWDLGQSFATTNSGVGPAEAAWFRAIYGPYVLNITVEPSS